MTEELFRKDAYLKSCDAKVLRINELGGIILDRTVFYPTGGGQPGDSGKINGVEIVTTVTDRETGEIVHVPSEGQSLPDMGADVTVTIDCILDFIFYVLQCLAVSREGKLVL
jgi:misacylated tRNA(Ala) deacylase